MTVNAFSASSVAFRKISTYNIFWYEKTTKLIIKIVYINVERAILSFTLTHELWNYSVKRAALVAEAFFVRAKLTKILSSHWNNIGSKLFVLRVKC
jgi:hypothetical protein